MCNVADFCASYTYVPVFRPLFAMRFLFTFFLILFLKSHAQEKTVFIQWDNSESLSITSSEINIEGAAPFFIDNETIPSELLTSWSANDFSYVNSKAVSVKYEPVSKNISQAIDVNSLPIDFEVTVEQKKSRNLSTNVLSFNPLFVKNGKVQRIISFNLEKRNRRLSARDANVPQRTSSVLATGTWRRFSIDTSGVFKITPQFLSSIGVNLRGVDPETIKIYGTGGKALPLRNDENRFYDIPEVPVKLIDNQDGVFSNDDYILFYGIGSQGYQPQNDSNVNPYSDETFYYVTTGGDVQKKITTIQEPAGVANTVFESYDFETFYERDDFNIGSLGRTWFGDRFDSGTRQRNYRFQIPNPVPGSDIRLSFPFAGVYQARPSLNINISAGSQVNENRDFGNFNSNSFAYGILSLQTATVTASPELNVNFDLDLNGDPSVEVYLDYIRVFATCQLRGNGTQFTFSNEQQASSAGISEFRISDASSVSSVWNITDPYNISEKNNLSSSNTISVKSSSGLIEQYLVLDESDLLSPTAVANSQVLNQDLKGNIFRSSATESNAQGEVDYLIITRREYVGAANRLADFRRKQDGFRVKIVTIDQIYNEFSTGQQDIAAIRNFVKYIYDNANSEQDRLRYLCIIGDTSYDYKKRIQSNPQIVPSYFATNSRSLSNSYVSDDFYGIMDATEGLNISRDLLDIAVGRIIAPTVQVANQMVDKTLSYYNRESFGTWRNKFLFVCDDVDNSNNGIDATLSLVLDKVAEDIRSKLDNANVNKLFSDAFRQEVSSAGARYPVVASSLINAFESGTAYINYFGHGGEDGISGEAIFRANDAQALTNRDRLTVFTTLTCELTRFDNPLRNTAGEFLFWNPNGGAVALLTTTRNLSFTTALGLNPVLAEALFDDNQKALPIGEALRQAKNQLVPFGDNRLAVVCVGDPALRIVFPEPRVELTKVNDINVEDFTGSLQALDKVKLEGRLVDNITNQLLTDFQGKIGVVLFDKIEDRVTLGNDGTVTCWEVNERSGFVRVESCNDQELFILDFKESGSAVFNGQATVENGIFTIEFILSKNIRLPLGEGKLSFYAENFEELTDQSGAATITIGGLNQNAEEDLTPPLINLFLNNENFTDGQLVNNTPLLIAKLNDASGINTAGGVGHDIVAIIDNDESNPLNLNEFYVTDLDDFTNGTVNFRLNGLSEGEHTLRLRVSDVFNNVSTQEISFRIGAADQFEVSEVLNYPNPFTSYTEFWFTHTGSPVDVLEVTIQVLSVSGKLITTKFATLSGNTNTYRGGISWDGKDDFGNKIGKGVYVYKIIVKSTLTKKTFSKFEKLVVL